MFAPSHWFPWQNICSAINGVIVAPHSRALITQICIDLLHERHDSSVLNICVEHRTKVDVANGFLWISHLGRVILGGTIYLCHQDRSFWQPLHNNPQRIPSRVINCGIENQGKEIHFCCIVKLPHDGDNDLSCWGENEAHGCKFSV